MRAKKSGHSAFRTGEKSVNEAAKLLKEKTSKAKGEKLMRLGSKAQECGRVAMEEGESLLVAFLDANRRISNGLAVDLSELLAEEAKVSKFAEEAEKAGMRALDLLNKYNLVPRQQ